MTKVAHGSHTSGEKQASSNFSVDGLREEIVHLNEFIQKTEREWAEMVIKLKRERLTALAALSRSKVMLAEMEIFIAENELNNFSYKSPKKLKLTENEDKSNQTSTQKPRRPISSRRRTASSNYNRSSWSSTSFSSMKPFHDSTNSYSTDGDQNHSSSTSVNPSNSKNTSAKSQSSISVISSHSKSISSSSSSDLNRHLTDSIIAEFDKPYSNNPSQKSMNNYLNIHKWSMSTPNNLPQKQSQVKIRPVSNIEAYKNSFIHESLSFKSRVLYAPSTSNMKPSLHPKDPRNNSKLFSDTHEKSGQTPMKLPVPRLMENTYVPHQYVTKGVKNSHVPVPTSPTQAGIHVPVLTPVIPQHKSVSTPQKHVPFPSSLKQLEVNHEIKHISTPHRSENTHIPFLTPPKRPENSHIPILTQQNSSGNRPVPISTPQNKAEHTPQKQHICVPTPPMYNNSPYVFRQNNKTHNVSK